MFVFFALKHNVNSYNPKVAQFKAIVSNMLLVALSEAVEDSVVSFSVGSFGALFAQLEFCFQ